MNIEKLAKHLKEFTLHEIEMIAECDCKTELKQLLNRNKIVFEQCLYKYQEEKPTQEFIICACISLTPFEFAVSIIPFPYLSKKLKICNSLLLVAIVTFLPYVYRYFFEKL